MIEDQPDIGDGKASLRIDGPTEDVARIISALLLGLQLKRRGKFEIGLACIALAGCCWLRWIDGAGIVMMIAGWRVLLSEHPR